MLHFIWTIIIGFVAWLIARAVTPGDKGPHVSSSHLSSASLALWRQPTSGRQLAGMGLIKMPGLLELSWAP